MEKSTKVNFAQATSHQVGVQAREGRLVGVQSRVSEPEQGKVGSYNWALDGGRTAHTPN
jgi:hypothetical protein